ncbi:polysaccharide deacetylase [Rhodopseudomonas palustris BisB5]|uniref:Chitooligosaccharide deacetylase n=1 Tax=Rhodopseudomonas palustris (strain BisB5) TaxID=316057 RepID=Q136R1_RHOPS|nr:polysaccharide deacetylase [Rhodopseudomonas palustris BisB5]
MSSRGWWAAAGLELAYFSGLARLAQFGSGGAGVILRFERVRPTRKDRFQPLRSREITPQFLDRLLRALRRWDCAVVSQDEVLDRIARPDTPGRFVCLTFDGGSRDLISYGHPVLARHSVPFTVYLPTAFPDGLGEAWWLALEQVIAGNDRIALMIDNSERRFDTASTDDKYRVFHFLGTWLCALTPPDLAAAIRDLCARYGVDIAGLTSEAVMNWEEVARLAADPHVTIGSATVNYPLLANASDVVAHREIAMGRAVLCAALGRDAAHFAYPYGERGSFTPRDVKIVEEAGFASAVTAIPGVIHRRSPSQPWMLPRIAWDGRRRSLRGLRVVLSGLMPGAAAQLGRRY